MRAYKFLPVLLLVACSTAKNEIAATKLEVVAAETAADVYIAKQHCTMDIKIYCAQRSTISSILKAKRAADAAFALADATQSPLDIASANHILETLKALTPKDNSQ